MITWLPSAYCCSKHLEHFKGEVTSTDNFIRLIFTTTLPSAYRFSEFIFRSETTSMFIHCCYDEDLFKILFSVGNAKIICFGSGNLFLDTNHYVTSSRFLYLLPAPIMWIMYWSLCVSLSLVPTGFFKLLYRWTYNLALTICIWCIIRQEITVGLSW